MISLEFHLNEQAVERCFSMGFLSRFYLFFFFLCKYKWCIDNKCSMNTSQPSVSHPRVFGSSRMQNTQASPPTPDV